MNNIKLTWNLMHMNIFIIISMCYTLIIYTEIGFTYSITDIIYFIFQ